jgi:arginine decarboxylase
LLPTPNIFTLVAGAGEGSTKLNSFDRALLVAKIHNVNLVKVSSILPPGASYVEEIILPPGSLVPTAYGALTSTNPGEIVSAAVAVGIPEEGGFGVIMEYAGYTTQKEAEEIISGMVREAFTIRGLQIAKYMVKSIEHKVEKAGTVFAGVVLWYK